MAAVVQRVVALTAKTLPRVTQSAVNVGARGAINLPCVLAGVQVQLNTGRTVTRIVDTVTMVRGVTM